MNFGGIILNFVVRSKVMKKETKKNTRKKARVTVTEKVGNYEKHPFFVEKANKAKEFLEKIGLPKIKVKVSN